MEIYLIRHTKPDIAMDICYGHSEIPLAKTFKEEVKALKRKIPSQFDIVYSSPLTRCLSLAKELKAKSCCQDPLLMELNFGAWEMKHWDEINQSQLNAWMKDFVNIAPPGGESFKELFKRTNTFLKRMMKGDYKSAGVVCHAGVIRSILANILKIPLENAFNLQLDYGKVSVIECKNNSNKVLYINT